QLTERKGLLHEAVEVSPDNRNLNKLLNDVDAALKEMAEGTYGICELCNEPIATDSLLADPLLKVCLSHLDTVERRALEDDLEYAGKIQRALLPEKEIKTDEWEFAHHYHPAGIVSGDFCDLIPANDGSHIFMLGDVSGKGVAASIMMSNLHALINSLQSFNLPINEILQKANRLFCESTLSTNYATIVVGRVVPDGTVEICVAGHNPPLIVKDGEVTSIGATGIPVGLFCNAEYDVERLKLNKNDFLFLYTDGLSEASINETEYGTDRIKEHLAKLNGLSANEIITNVLVKQQTFLRRTKFEDDITVAAIRKI
ncbi:MAG: SpoIIE family protein phosphatase, partial [Candidatus Heimdallarchaeota archaeon]|nr:SpoIIE family protein phosphatase [Candidatus Heimdallarchaeota archaeon]